MKQLDHNGLMLAEYQGKLFEESAEQACSTGIFIRRFLHSDLLKNLDRNDAVNISYDVNDGLRSIEVQFGESDYGKVKFSKNALFWIGYMYRYISYTRGMSTKYVSKLFDYRQMNEVYYTFHTQDPEWCVRNLLEMNGLTEQIFDKNHRLKEIMRRKCG